MAASSSAATILLSTFHPIPKSSLALSTITPSPSSIHLRPRPLFLRRSSSSSIASDSSPPPSFDLKTYWTTLISEIDAELDSAVPLRYPESIYTAMRYAVLSPGAKRAPPVMCVATACDLLGAPRAAAYPTACALEMVHAASLVHDDLPCMDAAQLRRGRPTTHAAFDVATAVLAGDALFPQGFSHILTHTPQGLVPEGALLRVVAEIARTVGSMGMAAGQFLDLTERFGGADVVTVLEKKFGELAECSAACGGILGGADEEALVCLRRYGRAVGVLYQVVDDILMEDNGENGKMQSKASVVRVHGMERAMEVAEELREKAKAELRWLAKRYGPERVMPLESFVEYAVERGFVVGEVAAAGTGQ